MVKHFLWDMTGKFGAQLVSLLLSFVLTRLLEPAEFGITGIAMVIVFVSSIFLDLGFARALVQYNGTGKREYSSVFFLQLLLGAILLTICYFAAAPLAIFYKEPQLEPVLQTLSLLFLFNSLALVPGAILQREMKFRQIAVSGLTGALVAGMISIAMALSGYGVWSLVAQYILAAAITTALSFYFARWRPALLVSKASLQPLWNYGSKLFFSGLLSTIVSRLDVFIIGKLFSTSILGHYTRAQSIDSTVRAFSAGSLSSVFFPAAARLQEDRPTLALMYKKYLHFAAFAAVGIGGLLYLITPDLFAIMFTLKWFTASGFFQIMCIAGIFWPLNMLMINVIAATGNAKAILQLEVIRTLILVPVYLYAFIVTGDITIFLWLLVGLRIVSLCLNALYVTKEIPVTMKEQFVVVFMYVLQGGIALLTSKFFFHYLQIEERWLRVLVYTILFGGVYMLLQYLIKTSALKEMNSVYKRWIAHYRTATK
jgi:teichuronic acid exporter